MFTCARRRREAGREGGGVIIDAGPTFRGMPTIGTLATGLTQCVPVTHATIRANATADAKAPLPSCHQSATWRIAWWWSKTSRRHACNRVGKEHLGLRDSTRARLWDLKPREVFSQSESIPRHLGCRTEAFLPDHVTRLLPNEGVGPSLDPTQKIHCRQ